MDLGDGRLGRADLEGALGDPRHSSLVPRIADAVAFLRDREAVGGGWNYGNRIVLDEALPPFAQTTAVALIGLRDLDRDLEERALAALRRLWRVESEGGLTLAMTVAAFRIRRRARDGGREATPCDGW